MILYCGDMGSVIEIKLHINSDFVLLWWYGKCDRNKASYCYYLLYSIVDNLRCLDEEREEKDLGKEARNVTEKFSYCDDMGSVKRISGLISSLFALSDNIMPQLEQSSLQPSSYRQHRHLLQTTSYNHLLRLHLLIPRQRKQKQKQARNPP